MNSLVCANCKAQNRVTKPIMVAYMHRRAGDRRCFYACWYCDYTDAWPNFVRTSPPIPKE